MAYRSRLLQSPIEYLKGVGPVRGQLLRDELGIGTFGDLLMDFPFRYVDRSSFQQIKDVREGDTVQLVGVFNHMEESGYRGGRRLTATFEDKSGELEVIWFRSANWVKQSIRLKVPYVIFGKLTRYRGRLNIAHPEIEAFTEKSKAKSGMVPVYSSTDKLTGKGLDARGRRKLIKNLLEQFKLSDIDENLPLYVRQKLKFDTRFDTLRNVHMPKDAKTLARATNRLKFEELFFSQLQLIAAKMQRKKRIKGIVFEQVGDLFHKFYRENLPFELTDAQKRVMKEIRHDLGFGHPDEPITSRGRRQWQDHSGCDVHADRCRQWLSVLHYGTY